MVGLDSLKEVTEHPYIYLDRGVDRDYRFYPKMILEDIAKFAEDAGSFNDDTYVRPVIHGMSKMTLVFDEGSDRSNMPIEIKKYRSLMRRDQGELFDIKLEFKINESNKHFFLWILTEMKNAGVLQDV
jgi:hypothetical protein